MGLLEGKRVLVTGGTTGLGLAIAERFLGEGARVVITGRDQELGERAVRSLGPGAQFIPADAGDPEAISFVRRRRGGSAGRPGRAGE